MNLVRIAARIANTTIQVDAWTQPQESPGETVSVLFPNEKGPAFSGKFLEVLARRYQIGMTEATETFGTSTDELEIGVDLYWDDSEERAWFKIVTIEGCVLAPEIVQILIDSYNLEDLVARALENVLTDPAMIQDLRSGQ